MSQFFIFTTLFVCFIYYAIAYDVALYNGYYEMFDYPPSADEQCFSHSCDQGSNGFYLQRFIVQHIDNTTQEYYPSKIIMAFNTTINITATITVLIYNNDDTFTYGAPLDLVLTYDTELIFKSSNMCLWHTIELPRYQTFPLGYYWIGFSYSMCNYTTPPIICHTTETTIDYGFGFTKQAQNDTWINVAAICNSHNAYGIRTQFTKSDIVIPTSSSYLSSSSSYIKPSSVYSSSSSIPKESSIQHSSLISESNTVKNTSSTSSNSQIDISSSIIFNSENISSVESNQTYQSEIMNNSMSYSNEVNKSSSTSTISSESLSTLSSLFMVSNDTYISHESDNVSPNGLNTGIFISIIVIMACIFITFVIAGIAFFILKNKALRDDSYAETPMFAISTDDETHVKSSKSKHGNKNVTIPRQMSMVNLLSSVPIQRSSETTVYSGNRDLSKLELYVENSIDTNKTNVHYDGSLRYLQALDPRINTSTALNFYKIHKAPVYIYIPNIDTSDYTLSFYHGLNGTKECKIIALPLNTQKSSKSKKIHGKSICIEAILFAKHSAKICHDIPVYFSDDKQILEEFSFCESNCTKCKFFTIPLSYITGASILINPATIDYTHKEKLGSGGFGCVYKAKMNSEWVAIKEIKQTSDISNKKETEQYLNDVVKELEALRSITSQYVIRFYGMIQTESITFVTEYARGGSLCDYIEKTPPNNEITLFEYNIMWDMIKGIIILHANGFHHRDIKPANIFLFTNGRPYAKIGDLGSCTQIRQDADLYNKTQTYSAFTPIYASPERLGYVDPTKMDSSEYIENLDSINLTTSITIQVDTDDVDNDTDTETKTKQKIETQSSLKLKQKTILRYDEYATALTIVSLMSRKVPYCEFNQPWKVSEAICNGKRPEIPEFCPGEFKNIIKQLWAQLPEDRIDLDIVLNCLETLGACEDV